MKPILVAYPDLTMALMVAGIIIVVLMCLLFWAIEELDRLRSQNDTLQASANWYRDRHADAMRQIERMHREEVP